MMLVTSPAATDQIVEQIVRLKRPFPPMDRQPAQAEASPSERCDLLRQLVPGPWSTDLMSVSSFTAALEEPETMLAGATTVRDPHPDRLQLPSEGVRLVLSKLPLT